MQRTTVPIPYEFTEDVICTKLIVYVSNIITSVRILMCIGFVSVVLCSGDNILAFPDSTKEIMNEKRVEMNAFSMIMGFPRFQLNRRNHDKCIGILAVFMILGFPRLQHHRRNHNKCMDIHAFSMILGFPRFPFKIIEIEAIAMSLGFPRFLLHREIIEHVWKSFHFQ